MTGSENAKKYFVVNEVTGEVYIKKPLYEDKDSVNKYTVCMAINPPLFKRPVVLLRRYLDMDHLWVYMREGVLGVCGGPWVKTVPCRWRRLCFGK